MTLSNKAGGYLTDLNIASLTSSFADISGIVPIIFEIDWICRSVENSV